MKVVITLSGDGTTEGIISDLNTIAFALDIMDKKTITATGKVIECDNLTAKVYKVLGD